MLHSWSAYCLVATGAVGLLLMQSAFNAGPLHASLPTITAGEPVAGILLGIVVFGDQISLSPASLAMHAGGLAALVVGVILVARAPALGNLRKAVVEPGHLPLPHLRDTGPHRALRSATAHLHVPQVSREPRLSQGPQEPLSSRPARARPGQGPRRAGPRPGQGPRPARERTRGARPAAATDPAPATHPARALRPRPGSRIRPAPPGAPVARLPGAPAPGEPPESLDHSGTASFALPTEPPTPVPPDPPRLGPAPPLTAPACAVACS